MSLPLGRPEADRFGPVEALVYRIATADGVQLAVTRLLVAGEAAAGPPVVLVHGSYSTRAFWVSPQGLGLASLLANRGMDVWIPDMRGHGLSPRSRGFSRWTAEDQLRHDLPAVQGLVAASRPEAAAHWVGHSFGGLALIGSLAAGWLQGGAIASVVTLGANISHGDEWLRRPALAALATGLSHVLGRVPARLFGLGPEPEPGAYFRDFVRWKGPRGRWETAEGASYEAGLASIRAPLLAFAAAVDKNDPAEGCRELFDGVGSAEKRFVVLGREGGFEVDYGHVEMIVSKPAAREVWPRIADWIGAHERSAG